MRNTLRLAPRAPAVMPAQSGKEPILEIGFPPPALVAVADKRYINRYNYDASNDEWVLIVDAQIVDGISHWAVRVADPEDGRPIGQVKKHTTDIWADRFADRPFDVRKGVNRKLEDLFAWFKRTCCEEETDAAKVQELFDSYLARLNYCSSFEALVRLGLRQP